MGLEILIFYKEFYNNGNVKVQGYNIRGKSDSTWVYFYEDGVKQTSIMDNTNNKLNVLNWYILFVGKIEFKKWSDHLLEKKLVHLQN